MALITGGASGIGLAECRLFAELGAKVTLADIQADEGQKQAALLGGDKCVFVRLDVTQPDQWKFAVESALTHFGGLNCLLNNAGILRPTPIESASVYDYMDVISTNQLGTFLGIQAVVPAMRKSRGGSIVNVASTSGVQGSPGPIIAYTASNLPSGA